VRVTRTQPLGSVVRALAVALAASALALAVLTAPALAKPVPHFYGSAAQESFLSDMANHPAAVRYGDKTWIAFQGPGYDPYVAEWDSGTKTWSGPFRIGTNALVLDAHGAPSLWVDPASGRLHAFWGGHHGPIRHSVTSGAGTIASWIALGDMATRGTYGQAIGMPDGSLVFFFRDSNSMSWVSRTSADGGLSFGSQKTVLLGDPHSSWYATFARGEAGRIHAAFMLQDMDAYNAGRIFSRYDLHYARRDPDGSWHTASGEALPAIPVVPASSASVSQPETVSRCRVFDSGTALVNEAVVREDDLGAPCITALVQTGPGFDDFTRRWWRYAGGTWSASDITDTDGFFDPATFTIGASGTVDAAVVAGTDPAAVAVDGDESTTGGTIERWVSDDRGATWSRGTPATISPDEPGIAFSDPVSVEGSPSPDARLVFMDWTNDHTDFWRRLYLWGDDGIVARESAGTAERLAGGDRALTSIAVSKRAFPERSEAVVIATGADFPDALAGAPLAAKLGGPLLLTPRTGLTWALRSEVTRLKPARAVILGGTDVVSDVVHQQLHQLGVTRVDRAAGTTRYDTMLSVSRLMIVPGNRTRTAVLVSGRSWADAASGATLAAANRWPVILTEPGVLVPQAKTALTLWGIQRTIVVGGDGAVSPAVFAQLPGAVRVAGGDRFDTAARVAGFGLSEGLLPDRVLLANGLSFPDALSAASLGQHLRAPLLLTAQSTLATASADYLEAHADRISAVFAAGGSGAVSESVWAGARAHAQVP
jgi:putative cell wall-binding protein